MREWRKGEFVGGGLTKGTSKEGTEQGRDGARKRENANGGGS